MALIICEECGKEFSSRAVACPNCGCPNQEAQPQQMVAENSALIAYNTDVIRRNTEISAYIDVFRW